MGPGERQRESERTETTRMTSITETKRRSTSLKQRSSGVLIWARCLANGVDHFANRPFHADEDRPSDDGVADVKFVNSGNGSNGTDIAEVKAMAGVDDHVAILGEAGGLTKGRQFPFRGVRIPGVAGRAVTTRVEFDHSRAGLRRGPDLVGVWIDKQTDGDGLFLEAAYGGLDPIALPCHIEPPLGGDLLALLRHEGNLIGMDGQREFEDRVYGCHFEIEGGSDYLPKEAYVAVLDVAPVFAEMDGDSGSAGQLAQHGGGNRIGFIDAPRLPHRRYVIDIHAQDGHGRENVLSGECSGAAITAVRFSHGVRHRGR